MRSIGSLEATVHAAGAARTGPVPTAGPRSRFADGAWAPPLAAAVIALGAALRLRAYFADRSLWLDEAMLALNVVERSTARLFAPLENHQYAPPAFLILEKLSVLALGPSERALRLVSLLAGLAALPLAFALARRRLSPGGAIFALAALALSPTLIYYAAEAKQYGFDVFVAVALLLALDDLGARELDLRAGAGAALIGVGALACSHPALFVLAAIGTAAALRALARGGLRALAPLALVGASWVAGFATLYALFFRRGADDDFLVRYWAERFAPFPPRSAADLGWYVETADRLARSLSGGAPPFLVVGLALTGAISLARAQGARAIALFLPLGCAFAASAAGRYPLEPRLLLFAAPILAIALAAGLATIAEARGWRLAAACALGAALLATPLTTTAERALAPPGREEVRDALRYVAAHRRPGDALYLHALAAPAFRFYRARLGLADLEPVTSLHSREDWSRFEVRLAALRGRPRVWIVFSAIRGDDRPRGDAEARHYDEVLERLGRRLDRFPAEGAWADLYDLGDGGAPFVEERHEGG
jgi:hypothetical protein